MDQILDIFFEFAAQNKKMPKIKKMPGPRPGKSKNIGRLHV